MLKKKRTLTETGFEYPDGWDPNKINVIAYEDTENLGEVEEYCIGLIHDDAYAEELLKNKAVVTEIDETEANLLGDKCKPQRIIVDDDKLPEILVALEKVPGYRSVQERRMLDPDSEEPGIRKTPKFNVKRWYPE